jgi:peptide chain release factor subunit 3
MSKLNASAFEFVPGKRFAPIPQQQQQPQPQSQPPLPPFIRPDVPDTPPPPPPTISLNIGSSKPSPAASPPPARDPEPARVPSVVSSPATKPQVQHTKAVPPSSSTSTPSRTPGSASPAPHSATSSSKTFTMGRAKTDTAAVAHEMAAVADQEVLDDLFGDSALYPPLPLSLSFPN